VANLLVPYQRVGCWTPFSSCLLARQDEATGARARKLDEARCHELSAPSLGIDQNAHRLREGRRLQGPFAVVRMPSVEQLDDLTAVRIVGLDGVNPHYRIATVERDEWIAALLFAADVRQRPPVTGSNCRYFCRYLSVPHRATPLNCRT
jgi:hypothetical protein